MAELILTGLFKRYGAIEAVKGIDLHIPDQSFVALVGPSGCGKTTTLRMIAGLEDISGGEIEIGGRVINDVAPKNRDIAMVFQSYALYPHMTVEQNMSFGLKLQGVPKAEIKVRVTAAAKALEIDEYLGRKPRNLSGGQRQRVAMGRAIVRNPKVFLFDEPLSNLDAKLRVQMRTEIKRVHQRVRTTTVYVTHDQIEAMTLADIIVVMNKGRIEQAGTPHELYHAPRSRFVAGFIGSPAMNFLDCTVSRDAAGIAFHLKDGVVLRAPAARQDRYGPYIGREMVLGLRPEHLTERREDRSRDACEFEAQIDITEPMGMETMIFFTLGGTTICARVAPDKAGNAGEAMPLRASMAHMHLIDPATELVV